MGNVVLFGNGPVARSAYYSFAYDSPHEVVAFTVDKEFIEEDTLFDLPVVPFAGVESAFAPDEYEMCIAVGYVQVNRLRAERYFQAKEKGYRLLNHISSHAIVAEDLIIGDNCRIGANCIVSPSAQIGNNVIVGAGAFVGHDVVLGDHCFIGNCAAIAGGVKIGPYAFLGISSTIRNKVAVARECVVGAGALILQDTEEREVYMGKQAELLAITSDNLPIK